MELEVLAVPLLGRGESISSSYPIQHHSPPGQSPVERPLAFTAMCEIYDSPRNLYGLPVELNIKLKLLYQHKQNASRKCHSACNAIFILPGLHKIGESPAHPWWSWRTHHQQLIKSCRLFGNQLPVPSRSSDKQLLLDRTKASRAPKRLC